MKILSSFFFCLFLLCPMETYAAAPVAIIETTLAPTKHLRSFEVQVAQEFYSAVREKSILSHGVLKFERPHSFRLEMGKPQEGLYVSDGKILWQYTPQTHHAQKMDAARLPLPFLDVLTRQAALADHYRIDDFKETSERLFFQLTPLTVSSTQPQSTHFFVEVKRSTGFFHQVELRRETGDWTKWSFEGWNKRAQFKPGTFAFVPPPGTVVDTGP